MQLESGETITKLAKEFNISMPTIDDMKRNSENIYNSETKDYVKSSFLAMKQCLSLILF